MTPFFKNFQSLNPGRAIAEIKKLLAGIAEKGNPGLEGTAGKIVIHIMCLFICHDLKESPIFSF